MYAVNSNQAIAEYGVGAFNSNSNGTIDVPYYNNAYSMNTNSTTYVAWNWLGGDASTNNNGTIQSSVSANTKSGFSIVSYTHGLMAPLGMDCLVCQNLY